MKRGRFHSVYVGQGQGTDLPDGTERETRTPADKAGFTSDVLVPLSQSLLTGALFATSVTFVVGLTDWRGDLGRLWLGVASVVALLAWLVLLGQTRSLLWGIERLTRRDLDQDGTVGRPQEPTTLEVVVKDGNHTRVVPPGWLGMSDHKLKLLASDLARGRSLSEGDLGTDRTLFPRGLNQYREARSKLVDAGLVHLVNAEAPNLGYELTRSGRAVMERLSGHTLTRTHAQRTAVSTDAYGTGEGDQDHD